MVINSKKRITTSLQYAVGKDLNLKICQSSTNIKSSKWLIKISITVSLLKKRSKSL